VHQLEEQKEELSTSIESIFDQLPSKSGIPSVDDLKTYQILSSFSMTEFTS